MPAHPRRKAKRASRANRAAKIIAARRRRQRQARITHDERLGYRLDEFAVLVGISIPTLWRRIRDRQIRVVDLGGLKLIPRSEAVRLGLIQ
jgi:hypothetical protein